MNAAANDDPGNLWITSATQTGGRGSRGRSWTSMPGNLFASVLLVDPCETRHLAELTFVAAIAVGNTLQEVLDDSLQSKVMLKWPNDVLVGGKKISGILLESSYRKNASVVTVGIGINCQSHPEDTHYPATCILNEGNDIKPLELFPVLAEQFSRVLSIWDRGRNFEVIRRLWLAHAAGIGNSIEVRLASHETVSGIFKTIDSNGHLLVTTGEGETRSISVGDVFFQSKPPAGERSE